jgi:uncharacterized membrane protein
VSQRAPGDADSQPPDSGGDDAAKTAAAGAAIGDAHDSAISIVSAWVLRGGVVVSSLVMLLGIALSFSRGRVTLERIKSDPFDHRPGHILTGIANGSGKAIIEAGIYLLLFTPILRVFASMVLFAFERDRLYALITVMVLVLTLAGLLWMG